MTQVEEAVFLEEQGAVSGVHRSLYRDLVLAEKPSNKVAPESLAQCLAEQAAPQFERIFQPNKAARDFWFRLHFASKYMPEENWPDVSEAGLCARLPELCMGKRKLADLQKLDWHQVMSTGLSWKSRKVLDEQVPERLAVPSGSLVRIDYEPAFGDGGLPVLAVRLQEVFGWTETPTVVRGRVPILCHLLAPNMRPAQITRDLRGFWNQTYAEVRKELRQRYPKHSWPEDPWTAKAVRGTGRRRKG